MVSRCTNPSHRQWIDYGGRGIEVCSRWLNSFAAFLEDMGAKPAGLSLDREDNDGNYQPGNCRWATPAQQQRNRRVNKLDESKVVEIRSSTLSGKALAAKLGVNPSTVTRVRTEKRWGASSH